VIRIYYRHASGTLVRDLPPEQLPAAVRDPAATVWVDLHDPTPEERRLVLEEVFQFHPLAVEDTENHRVVPKIDDYRRYLYMVIHSVYAQGSPMNLTSHKMDVFLSTDYLVTLHRGRMGSVEEVWEDEPFHRTQGLARGPAFVLYELLDRQVSRFTRLVDRFEAALEELGDEIFQKGNIDREGILDDLLTATSSALRLLRVLRPQRSLMGRLAHADHPLIPQEARYYFDDIADHLDRMIGLVESSQELARSTVDVYMALANNRMNEIMKVLTIFSVIFIPLGFLAAVYGMNFAYMPELRWPWAYPAMWALFALIALGLLGLFRRWKWI